MTDRNEFSFCRKILYFKVFIKIKMKLYLIEKKQGMSSSLYEKEKDYNIHDLNNEMDIEAHDIQTALLLQNDI